MVTIRAPRDAQLVSVELLPPHDDDAPPPYQEAPPSVAARPPYPTREPCPHCQNCRHGQLPPQPPPQVRAQAQPRHRPNSVERLYKTLDSCNFYKWYASMACLGTSAAMLAKFPGSTLRPFLIYLISISALHFFCLNLTARPFSSTTPRPPLHHFLALAVSTAMCIPGPVGLFAVIDRDLEAAVPGSRVSEEDKKHIQRWEAVSYVAGIAGITALLCCIAQWYGTMRLSMGRFHPADVREAHKRIWDAKKNAKSLRKWFKKRIGIQH